MPLDWGSGTALVCGSRPGGWLWGAALPRAEAGTAGTRARLPTPWAQQLAEGQAPRPVSPPRGRSAGLLPARLHAEAAELLQEWQGVHRGGTGAQLGAGAAANTRAWGLHAARPHAGLARARRCPLRLWIFLRLVFAATFMGFAQGRLWLHPEFWKRREEDGERGGGWPGVGTVGRGL